ncbi:Translation initiation factor 2 [hydrothermal vent metagenome]|uniref:Translation initiation factor 2 n=1 Tax=hydrothermal vent metagenome TaxID=652676 RepID=A0A3B1D8B9_9ZZZZ
MNVTQLAEELNTTEKFILETLKSLKLKAKGESQELNVVVASVVKGHIVKKGTPPPRKALVKREAADPKEEVKKTVKKTVKKGVKKKVADNKEEDKGDKKEETKEVVVKNKKTDKSVKAKKIDEKSVEAIKEEPQKKVLPKVKPKISNAPVITLKPLARKKRKSMMGSRDKGKDNTSSNKPSSDDLPSEKAPTFEERLERDESLPNMEIDLPITVKDLSLKLQQKPSIVMTKLMKLGLMCHINQSLAEDVVERLTREFGFNLAKIRTQEEQLIDGHKQEDEDPALLSERAPVVTFMGHVDHGKTTLLDKIRQSKVADGEHGGITQHMSAYSVEIPKGRITFLDTPGHAAFTAMRARGAHITDLIVLVVAADEGIMPQTREAIDHARAADVPIVVALNKMDRPNADADRVKQQLAEVDLASEDWGGKTVVAPVSAMTGEGLDDFLELICLEAEMLELKANAEKKASGLIVEAHLSQGRGAVTTVIVQAGTLKEGDIVVVGPHYGKVKAMYDDHHRLVKGAGPSMPIELIGLSDVPEAGEPFYVVEDEKQARDITFKRQEDLKDEKLGALQKVTLENLYDHLAEGSVKELNVIIKADAQGSLEALKDSLEKIPSDKVRIKFIHLGVGDVNASDVVLALASKAIIIAFHVGTGPRAKEELKKTPVDIREYRIIYDAVADMHSALEGMLEAKTKKNFLSRIEIRQVFKLSKQGVVAGCYVEKGKVHRKANIDIVRNDDIVFTGIISSLKRFKDDVKEVTEGMECGITINGFDKIQSGDVIEAYDLESIVQRL